MKLIAITLLIMVAMASQRKLFEIHQIKEKTDQAQQVEEMQETEQKQHPIEIVKEEAKAEVIPAPEPYTPVAPVEVEVQVSATEEKSEIAHENEETEKATVIKDRHESKRHHKHKKHHERQPKRYHRQEVDVDTPEHEITGQVFVEDECYGCIMLGIVVSAIIVSFFIKRCIRVRKINRFQATAMNQQPMDVYIQPPVHYQFTQPYAPMTHPQMTYIQQSFQQPAQPVYQAMYQQH